MKDSKIGLGGRRWLFLLALVGLTLLVVTRFANLQNVAETLSQGLWPWVVAGFIMHFIFFFLYALLYQSGFSTVGVRSRARDLLPLVFAAVFVNAIAPTAGAGAGALFVDDAVQRGQSGARTIVGVILVLLADLGTLIPFIVAGTIFLSFQRDLRFYDTIGSIFFTIFVGGLSGALVLAQSHTSQLRHLLGWLQQTVNQVGRWLKHPDLLADDWADRNTDEFVEGARAIAEHPGRLTRTLALGVLLHTVNVVGLYMLFLAFQQPVRLGTLMAGFGLGIVFWVISIIPQGTGVVEGVMALIFISLGIPKSKAIVITLTFRGLNFWLPLLIGFLVLRRVRTFGVGGNIERKEEQSGRPAEADVDEEANELEDSHRLVSLNQEDG
jgi:uncharacterized protein (TIRG00374 family)